MRLPKMSFDLEKHIEAIGQASNKLVSVEIFIRNYSIFDDYFCSPEMSIDKKIKILIDKILEKNIKVIEFLDNCPESQWREFNKINVLIGLFVACLTPAQIKTLSEFTEVRYMSLRLLQNSLSNDVL